MSFVAYVTKARDARIYVLKDTISDLMSRDDIYHVLWIPEHRAQAFEAAVGTRKLSAKEFDGRYLFSSEEPLDDMALEARLDKEHTIKLV